MGKILFSQPTEVNNSSTFQYIGVEQYIKQNLKPVRVYLLQEVFEVSLKDLVFRSQFQAQGASNGQFQSSSIYSQNHIMEGLGVFSLQDRDQVGAIQGSSL